MKEVKLCIRCQAILKFTYCLIQYNIVFVPIDVVEYTVQKNRTVLFRTDEMG